MTWYKRFLFAVRKRSLKKRQVGKKVAWTRRLLHAFTFQVLPSDGASPKLYMYVAKVLCLIDECDPSAKSFQTTKQSLRTVIFRSLIVVPFLGVPLHLFFFSLLLKTGKNGTRVNWDLRSSTWNLRSFSGAFYLVF